ncbi:hypothetical protein ACS9ZL_08495 [Stenotrophomonas africana]
MKMGDRALIQLKNENEVSPVLYLHWGGSDVKRIIESAKERMKGRHDDLSYAFARLVQIATGDDGSNTGFGVWNHADVLHASDSHGDAGCFVVNISSPDWETEAFGGYGFSEEQDEEEED